MINCYGLSHEFLRCLCSPEAGGFVFFFLLFFFAVVCSITVPNLLNKLT